MVSGNTVGPTIKKKKERTDFHVPKLRDTLVTQSTGGVTPFHNFLTVSAGYLPEIHKS